MSTATASPRLQRLLDRLPNPRRYGNGWRDRCPAHDGQSTTSLAIRETRDGRTLLYCHAGCGAHRVLDALGLEFGDLMPERLDHHATPEQRRRWREDALHRDWLEIINEVALELQVVDMKAGALARGEAPPKADRDRIALALQRVRTCLRVLND